MLLIEFGYLDKTLTRVVIAALVLFVPVQPVRSESRLDSQPGIVKAEFIFEHAPFRECHASTIVETKSGLVAAWFGGTKEANPDVGVWLSRKIDGVWTAPVEVANGAETEVPRRHCINPVLFQMTGGPLFLFYKTGEWWAYTKRSADDGVTWSKPERMENGFFGPIKNKPVLLPDGSILSPSSSEFGRAKPGGNPGSSNGRVHFERSTSGGKSWQFIGPVNDGIEISAIQPSILFHPGNRLQAIGRTEQGRLFETWSDDGGISWGTLSLTTLPNNDSGTDAVTLRDQRHLIVYNHRTNDPGRTHADRTPLNVSLSKDGKTWQAALVLEDEPRREFSYPAVIQAADGLVHITYTWKRQKIKHVVVDPSKLVLRDLASGDWPR
jgi:predicted neuraminidase